MNSDGTAKDLTGCQIKMQIRDQEGGSVLWGTWTNGTGFTLDAANGAWSLTITNNESSLWDYSKGVYDIVVTWPDTKTDAILDGVVTLSRGVTV